MANELSSEVLKRLARLGAQARLRQIEDERREILRAFPGLAPGRITTGAQAEGDAGAPGRKARKRRKRTAAEKQAASERMKEFWAARRQQG